MHKDTICKRQRECGGSVKPSVGEFALEYEGGGRRKLGRVRKPATKREQGLFFFPREESQPRSQSGHALNRVAGEREREVNALESRLKGVSGEALGKGLWWSRGGPSGPEWIRPELKDRGGKLRGHRGG